MATQCAQVPYSFRCRLTTRPPEGEEEEPVRQVLVGKGYLQVIGTEPELVAETALDATSDGCVYIVWTYTTDSAAGSWGELTFGTPPAEDSTRRVVIIAEVSGDALLQRHLGDVVVLDIVDRTDCV